MRSLAGFEDRLLHFKTVAAGGIEAGRNKGVIDPRLSDHVHRQALELIDELKRAGRQQATWGVIVRR